MLMDTASGTIARKGGEPQDGPVALDGRSLRLLESVE
jgi:hypothetical protein